MFPIVLMLALSGLVVGMLNSFEHFAVPALAPAAWNIVQYPAASVPAGIHPGVGTPLAVQVVGPTGTESRILGLSAQVERLAPWRRRAPGY